MKFSTRYFRRCYVNRGKVTSWRLLGSPLAAPSIMKQVPHSEIIHFCAVFYNMFGNKTLAPIICIRHQFERFVRQRIHSREFSRRDAAIIVYDQRGGKKQWFWHRAARNSREWILSLRRSSKRTCKFRENGLPSQKRPPVPEIWLFCREVANANLSTGGRRAIVSTLSNRSSGYGTILGHFGQGVYLQPSGGDLVAYGK
jgi:hypothetical protein